MLSPLFCTQKGNNYTIIGVLIQKDDVKETWCQIVVNSVDNMTYTTYY